MSTHKPATALPWEHNGRKPEHIRKDDKPETVLACAVWHGNEKPICTTRFSVGKYAAGTAEQQDANVRYIVHAANAYPELVDTLRHGIEVCEPEWRGDKEPAWMQTARALLLNLGES